MYLSTLIDTIVQTEAQWAIIDIGYRVTVKWFIIFINCSDGLYVYKAITLYTGVPDRSRALSAAASPISRISIDVGVLLERRNKWMKNGVADQADYGNDNHQHTADDIEQKIDLPDMNRQLTVATNFLRTQLSPPPPPLLSNSK
ncbi:conserved hypothetical protein [Trichinella spiralis]|uniref:hypothetical protein n=1 Tax=Trichinella spiralis TaxID=6334 RepID=UPI0001EFE661|nr:conserved hypothetical protein [Trichinella spiralis]